MKKRAQKTSRKGSIQTRIGIRVLAIITGILILFGGYQYFDIQKELKQELEELAEMESVRMAANLVIPLWNFDVQQVRKVILSEMREKKIYAVVVWDDRQNLFAGKKRDEEWDNIIDTEEDIFDDVITSRSDIIQDDSVVGSVAIYVTRRFMAARLWDEIVKIVLTIIILDVSLLVFLAVTLRKMLIRPITRLLGIANGIAAGDFSQEILIRQQDEIGDLADAFRNMKDIISGVLTELGGLNQAIQEGQLANRARAERFSGNWQKLIVEINAVIDAFVTPFNTTAGVLARLSKGDLPNRITGEYQGDFNTIKENLNLLIDAMQETTRLTEEIAAGNLLVDAKERSENDRLMKALNAMIRRLNEILSEVDGLIQAVQAGQLDVRGKATAFSGAWRDLVVGINNVIDAFVEPLNTTAGYIDQIARGGIPEKITTSYQGDFNEIKNNLNGLIDGLQALTTAAHGIANGDMSVQVPRRSEEDILATAFQHMSKTIGRLIAEIDRLVEAALAGQLETRGASDKFQGDFARIVQGVNNTLDAVISPLNVAAEYVDRIARGDIPEKIIDEYEGDFNEIRNNLNLLIDAMHATIRLAEEIAGGNLAVQVKLRSENDGLMQALQMMIQRLNTVLQELDTLLGAVQEGQLTRRGNAGVFAGGWRDLVVGVNNVIEAFVTPFTQTATTIDRIAKGAIPDLITEEYKGDFNQIKTNLNMLIEATQEVTRMAEAMAEGNLTVDLTERSEEDKLMRALNAMTQRLKEVVVNVKAAADNLTAGSMQLSASSEQLSESAGQQAASTEEVSSSMEQMAANTRQNADNARQTEKLALRSAEYAEEGGKVVAEAVVAMQQIAGKILIIEEIATQTRMLSLNATIEAARAQEHGKAFSVVASEVRKLSDITKKAAEEISNLAMSSLEVSKKAGEMLSTLVPSIHQTTDLVQEISATSSEQSTGTEHINTAIQQLDQVTQHNASMAENLAATAEELTRQANQLQRGVAFFKIGAREQQVLEKSKPEWEQAKRAEELEEPGEAEADRGELEEEHAGLMIDMRIGSKDGDERDAEFERY